MLVVHAQVLLCRSSESLLLCSGTTQATAALLPDFLVVLLEYTRDPEEYILQTYLVFTGTCAEKFGH